jgi:hypothetical protein
VTQPYPRFQGFEGFQCFKDFDSRNFETLKL